MYVREICFGWWFTQPRFTQDRACGKLSLCGQISLPPLGESATDSFSAIYRCPRLFCSGCCLIGRIFGCLGLPSPDSKIHPFLVEFLSWARPLRSTPWVSVLKPALWNGLDQPGVNLCCVRPVISFRMCDLTLHQDIRRI